MGLLFLRDEIDYFLAVVEEITQAVKHLCIREVKGIGNFQNGFAAQVEGSNVAHCDAQTVDDRLPAAHGLALNNVGMFGFK